MKGNLRDFLQLAAEKPALARDLIQLAARHDFEFTADELDDAQLDSVVGGATSAEVLDAQLATSKTWQAGTSDYLKQMTQALSNISKQQSENVTAITRV